MRSIMVYAYLTWEYEPDAHLLQLQRLQNRVLRVTDNFKRRKHFREMNVAFRINYAYNFVTKLCRK
jgi:hypothetical protein